MSSLSTHVLDTAHGKPAAGVVLRLSGSQGEIFRGLTNEDGRCPGMPDLGSGLYRLEFDTAAYFIAQGVALTDPPFLDVIAINFGVSGDGHYHVPLLVSPFAYSTYRGS